MRFENRKKQPLRGLDDWRRLAPPARAELHWREGRSAYELAKDWLEGNAEARVADLLARVEGLQGFTAQLGIAERRTRFDNIPGGPRNHDLLVVGDAVGGTVVIGVEGKADEPFGDGLIAFPQRAIKRNALSRAPERLDRLTQAIFNTTVAEEPSLGGMGYQLLSGLAGTLAEASEFGAELAVFLVHEFVTPHTTTRKLQLNGQVLNAFTQRLGAARLPGVDPDAWITDAITIPGNEHLASTVSLHIAKLVTRRA